jgi:hypothetical protein
MYVLNSKKQMRLHHNSKDNFKANKIKDFFKHIQSAVIKQPLLSTSLLINIFFFFLIIFGFILLLNKNSNCNDKTILKSEDIKNIKFYLVDENNNIQYKNEFSQNDSISVSYQYSITEDTKTFKNKLIKDGQTTVFEFEMPLTGTGERKFVLPKQGETFETGEYMFEIIDDHNQTILKNNFKIK